MIDLLKSEIESYSRYEKNQLFFIDENGKDYSVKNDFTFVRWLSDYTFLPTIKVEGLESNKLIKSKFNFIKNINSIHLFLKNKEGYSFDWHSDNTNVYLYVLIGRKRVRFQDTEIWLGNNDGTYIKKGTKHKVESDDDTWALSIGYS